MTKPFSTRELVSRVRAILRRSSTGDPDEKIKVGPIMIDSENYEAFRNGEKMILTLKEYELLKALASSPGRVLSRDFLLDRIWGHEYYGETRTVDVHIRHIRQKLGDDAGMIETVRGVGYKLTTTA
jgi:two-component system alkaline phosphatase synthesis response regulator PhoP